MVKTLTFAGLHEDLDSSEHLVTHQELWLAYLHFFYNIYYREQYQIIDNILSSPCYYISFYHFLQPKQIDPFKIKQYIKK